MFQEIYVIEDRKELTFKLQKLFKVEKNYKIISVPTVELDEALKGIPELIIINEDKLKMNLEEVCIKIRNDEDNCITPIVVISSDKNKKHRLNIIKHNVEYFITTPVEAEFIYNTVKNILRLIYVNRTISPLTGLPGNVQIQAELKKRLSAEKDFYVLYLDLDNFKSYNDAYGFLKGDEIIKLTARIITRNIHLIEDSEVFVGHIGGDDFVAIVEGEVNYDEICQNIIAEFDAEILEHFNDEDIERGYVEVPNRKGNIEEFPLTSISIGVVVAESKRFSNILEIGEVGAQVKHMAKVVLGSSYAIDRRESL